MVHPKLTNGVPYFFINYVLHLIQDCLDVLNKKPSFLIKIAYFVIDHLKILDFLIS
jgi:hypothetical protein